MSLFAQHQPMTPSTTPSSSPPPTSASIISNVPMTSSSSAKAPTSNCLFVAPPPERTIATGVANLGNTCYMNAALQALAHAPELCHALDAESHVRKCPVALRNERRRRLRLIHEQNRNISNEGEKEGISNEKLNSVKDNDASDGRSSTESTPEKKLKKRRSRDRNSADEGTSDRGNEEDKDEFCTLCEVERLLGRVHSRPEEVFHEIFSADDALGGKVSNSGEILSSVTPKFLSHGVNFNMGNNSVEGPVVPEAFVSGFMSKVAPWFRRGVQEDSHEFLRLLIDAMQSSCKAARNGKGCEKKLKLDVLQEGSSNDAIHGSNKHRKENEDEDTEYPFRLFRGTVESNVKCSACCAVSCKIDPIEDIGLDILPVKSAANQPSRGGGYGGSSRGPSSSSSRSTSPISTVMALADVQQALDRFTSIEHLDSGYKCEQCGRLGKATKTSRLASIPPILTLHLKRFRYGSVTAATMSGSSNGNGGLSSTRSSRSARGTSAAYADSGGTDYVGPSGSAKIEGHVAFGQILDIKPYLTAELQTSIFKKAFCRLFAVVVHTGKNSHSGHYVAYVCNVSRSEWWKMDDARVIRSNWEEVKCAEAYMLFYRVMDHPVAKQLKADAESVAAEKAAAADAARVAASEEEEAVVNTQLAAPASTEEDESKSLVTNNDNGKSLEITENVPPSKELLVLDSASIHKRECPRFASGVEWAKECTNLPPEYHPLFQRIEEYIGDNIQFRPEFFRYITDEIDRSLAELGPGKCKNRKIKSLLGNGPSGVNPQDDVQDEAQDFKEGILDLFHQLFILNKSTNNRKDVNSDGSFLLSKLVKEVVAQEIAEKEIKDTNESHPATDKVLPALTIDDELVIPDTTENYDGAL